MRLKPTSKVIVKSATAWSPLMRMYYHALDVQINYFSNNIIDYVIKIHIIYYSRLHRGGGHKAAGPPDPFYSAAPGPCSKAGPRCRAGVPLITVGRVSLQQNTARSSEITSICLHQMSLSVQPMLADALSSPLW